MNKLLSFFCKKEGEINYFIGKGVVHNAKFHTVAPLQIIFLDKFFLTFYVQLYVVPPGHEVLPDDGPHLALPLAAVAGLDAQDLKAAALQGRNYHYKNKMGSNYYFRSGDLSTM